MKNILLLFLLAFSSLAAAATYYIAPAGNDASGKRSKRSPWSTLNKIWTVISAGDTVYLRGGTYQFLSQHSVD